MTHTVKKGARWLRSAALIGAAAALITETAAAGGSMPLSEHRWEVDLTGSWRVSVTLYNCSSGIENPAFASLLTFGADGTLVETTNNAVFKPGQRTPGHGFWEHTGHNEYRAVSEAFIVFGSPPQPPLPGFQPGVQRIEQDIRFTDRRHFSSEASVSFMDAAGSPLGSACARAKGERLT